MLTTHSFAPLSRALYCLLPPARSHEQQCFGRRFYDDFPSNIIIILCALYFFFFVGSPPFRIWVHISRVFCEQLLVLCGMCRIN